MPYIYINYICKNLSVKVDGARSNCGCLVFAGSDDPFASTTGSTGGDPFANFADFSPSKVSVTPCEVCMYVSVLV